MEIGPGLDSIALLECVAEAAPFIGLAGDIAFKSSLVPRGYADYRRSMRAYPRAVREIGPSSFSFENSGISTAVALVRNLL